jgi:hypothetical protein
MKKYWYIFYLLLILGIGLLIFVILWKPNLCRFNKTIDNLNQQLIDCKNTNQNLETDSSSNEAIDRVNSAGGKTGVITVSLIWNSIDDLDLALIEPSGTSIYYLHNLDDYTHGELDIDNNASEPLSVKPVENIYINNPINGKYQLRVNWYGKNGSNTQSVNFYCIVRINGEVKHSFNGILNEPKNRENLNNWQTFYEFNYPN